MASLALAFDILARDRASREFDRVADSADKAGRKGGRFGSTMKGAMGLAAGAVAAAGLGSMFTGFIKDAAESARIGRLTAAVVKSTGGVANVSVAQVNELAEAISNKTAIDDEAIQSSANLLLTFTKVRNEMGKGNDIFDQATLAAANMSAAMGTDLQGATLQLGKALNDPIKGVTALGRAGVQFTQQQKDQIKTLVESGDTLGAQKIILGEMQTQFGGAAAAAADPLARLQVIAGNLGEKVGGLLLPYVEQFATFVSDRAIPAIEGFIDTMGPKLAPVIAAVRGFFAAGAEGQSKFAPLVTFFQTQLVPAFGRIVEAVRGFVTVALPIAQAFVAGMMARIAPMMPQVRAIFTAIGQIVTSVMGLVQAVIQRVTAIVSGIWSRWGTQIMNFAAGAFRFVISIVTAALKIVQGVIKTVTAVIKGDWSGAWAGIKQIVSGAWDAIKAIVSAALTLVKGIVSGAWTAIKTGTAAMWAAVRSAIAEKIAGIVETVKSIPGRVVNAVGNLGSLLLQKGRDLVQGLIDGILGKIQAVRDAAGSVAQAIKDFFPGSPVKKGPLTAWNNGGAGKRLGDMLAGGLDSSRSAVERASRGLAGAVVDPTAVSASTAGPMRIEGTLDLGGGLVGVVRGVVHGELAGVAAGASTGTWD